MIRVERTTDATSPPLKHIALGTELNDRIGVAVQGKIIPNSEVPQSNVAELMVEKAAIAQKQGELWECIGRSADIYGGYIYHYKLKDEYNFDIRRPDYYDREMASSQKQSEIFPAIEPRKFLNISDINNKLKPLGYSARSDENGVFLSLPDKQAIDGRYAELRKKHPHLKPLLILSSAGIADDLTFLQAYPKCDALLSDGKEFVHDHFSHLIPTLCLFTEKAFHPKKEQLKEIISHVCQAIVRYKEKKGDSPQLARLVAAISGAVDGFWGRELQMANEKMGVYFSATQPLFINSWFDHRYDSYWEKRFGEEFDSTDIKTSWSQVLIEAKL